MLLGRWMAERGQGFRGDVTGAKRLLLVMARRSRRSVAAFADVGVACALACIDICRSRELSIVGCSPSLWHLIHNSRTCRHRPASPG